MRRNNPIELKAKRLQTIQKDGTWYCYGWDLTKNVCEIFGQAGYIRTTYAYTPYGTVTAEGDVTQPLQWSSEYADSELGLVYYNYRSYNPIDGRWNRRDPLNEQNSKELYVYALNSLNFDRLGLWGPGWEGGQTGSCFSPGRYQYSNMSTHSKCITRCPKDRVFRETPSGYCEYRTRIPKENYQPTANGCGAKGGISVPDSFNLLGPQFDFSSACDKHDICYGTCGSKKGDCDSDFLHNMRDACLQAMSGYGIDLIMLTECKLLADIYYGAVVVFGGGAYQDAQSEACVWRSC